MKICKRIWQAVIVIALLVALIIIRQTITSGMANAFIGKPVDAGVYLGSLIAAVLLVCIAIFAGIMARLQK